MLEIRLADLRNNFERHEKMETSDGWKTSLAEVDWENLMLDLDLDPFLANYASGKKSARFGKCFYGEKSLLLENILEQASLKDALWALGAIRGYPKACRLFAVQCIRPILSCHEKFYPAQIAMLKRAVDLVESSAKGIIKLEQIEVEKNIILDTLRSQTNDYFVDHFIDNLAKNFYVYDNWDNYLKNLLEFSDEKIPSNLIKGILAIMQQSIEDNVWEAVQYSNRALCNIFYMVMRSAKYNSEWSIYYSNDKIQLILEFFSEAIDKLAIDGLAATSGMAVKFPSKDDLKEKACNSIEIFFKNISPKLFCDDINDNIKNAILWQYNETIKSEFIKFCRLDAEYSNLDN
jgi:hypothetical protein